MDVTGRRQEVTGKSGIRSQGKRMEKRLMVMSVKIHWR